jgi:putative DNA primase/helicase
MNSITEFREVVQARGLRPPTHIEPGKLHRCASSDRAGDSSGWLKLFPDSRGGVYGDWRGGWKETWQAQKPESKADRDAFREQVKLAQKQAQAERDMEHAAAASRATEIYESAPVAQRDKHAYLINKKIGAHGIGLHEGSLVVPVMIGDQVHSLQFIAPDGTKKFLPGGKVTGGYYMISEPENTICIAEGYATGASIHAATDYAVAVAFNCGNLEPVAREIRRQFPTIRIIVCADDDHATEGNPGITKARAAAAAVGGLLAVPYFEPEDKEGRTDFNDMALVYGKHEVSRFVNEAVAVTPSVAPSAPLSKTGATGATGANGATAILTRGDAITPEPISWLWPGWLAAGKLHIKAGSPGTGKTTIALAVAATITIAGRWPDGTAAERGSVVIWSGEDDPADVLVPRLLAMGADVSRIHIVSGITGPEGKRAFDPARDVDLLADAMRQIPDVHLLIVDPIVSAVAGDSHHNAETRRGLQPLVDLAQAHRCALLGITHLSKGTAGRDPLERVTGSLAFGALARIVTLAAREQGEDDKPGRRMLLRAKSNIGPDNGGFFYDLRQDDLPGHPGITASNVLWGAAIEGNTRELLAQAEQQDDAGGEHRSAADWLRDLLATGPQPVASIQSAAKESGLAWRTVQRAMERAGITSKRGGFGQPATWSLPISRATDPSVAPVTPLSKAGANGATGVDGDEKGTDL